MQDLEKKYQQLNDLLDGRVQLDEPLARHTTFKIGGVASLYFRAESNEDLVRAITYARKFKIPFYLLSGGSNVLVSDEGIDKFVIHIKSSDLFVVDESYIVADAGVLLADLVALSIQHGLEGLVWASGIPGDVGGAVRGNAGAYGGEMKDSVDSVEVMRGRKQFIMERKDILFGYRDSQFKQGSDIVLTVKFKLKPGGDVEKMRQQSQEIIAERETKHTPGVPSAGSFFKNVPITDENREQFKKLGIPEKFWEYGKVAAGWLLDEVGMRGYTVGGAQVSNAHGNIVINTGDATADDVLQLTSIMKMKVRDELGIQLEEEVQYVGF
jgi:UDP-N-acetylmuramate dehydrogenase